MKKLIALSLAGSLALTLAACGGTGASENSSEAASPSEDPISSSESEEAGPSSESTGDLAALGDIDVEDNLFDVEITIPADYVEGATQEEIEQEAAEAGVHSATLNDDGSVTFVMSKSQHEKLLEDMRASIQQSLNEMVGSEEYPNITSIETNDDFTEFTVTTTSSELSLEESFSVMAYYVYSGVYGVFSGETPENVHVDFVNADTGEILESADSSEMAEDTTEAE
ncbi:MAG: hypothetical protein DBX91_14230 [Subdoligranulum variabile]|nr:MAG: hypothetical protein DBX91_14230 [Subdoligranulum variabile]